MFLKKNYMIIHLKDELQIKFIILGKEMMQETALTSFALHDLYRTDMSHEQ